MDSAVNHTGKPLAPGSHRERIETLDGWRALAALAVIVCHLGATFSQSEDVYQQTSPLRYGALGVDFFFGLSGLLITSLLLKELRQTGRIALRDFYLRRFFRIAPAALVFVVCIWAGGRMRSIPELISSLFFFRNYLPDHLGSSLTNHLWSLAVEAHFYLFWPALLLWAGVKRGASTAAYLAIADALYRMIDSQTTHTGLLADILPLYRTDLRLDALLWGCVLAFVLENPNQRTKLRQQLRFLPWLAIAAIFGLLTVYSSPMIRAWTPLLIPVLITGTILHKEWIFSRFLESGVLKWIGRISYSLYIWQQIIYLIVPGKPGAQAWPAWLIIPLIPICAVASYYWIETPMIRFGRNWIDRRPVPTVAPLQA